ncbi:cobalamin-independent methionine synthase II family protein [Nanchangia anserum]|uniref:Cobalamin-independent methionine synthase II family protein n=1 Tax=Nanchangia anserum TaxID=2692125 RepID=A0A8I0G853_9ACTO|nr:cobalamin-independent methionine synthase II family protein [Nanchangia anserum]MBD3689655.1 cobalamin-independent methionine synthase II family protein [Nanchangia anserum]QOX81836.1 cobalamin-independent methionine synthase II family protein [Nanchangia anserum]
MSRVRTTHVGSLPRTPELLAANEKCHDDAISQAEFDAVLTAAADDVVARQASIGLDIVNEGEYGHITSGKVDYGAWWNYSFTRLGGLELTDADRWDDDENVESTPGNIRLTSFQHRRDWSRFRDAYTDPTSGILTHRARVKNPKIVAPLTYIGHDAVAKDVELLLHGLNKAGKPASDGFVAALSPGSCARIANEYYASDEEVVWACADALREEYTAITDAGLTVQIDDPSVAEAWDQIQPEPSVEDYRDFIQVRIDALNHALAGIPREQVRFHICWGSWHGPHTTDIGLEHIIDKVLQVEAGAFTFEAANARHAHEWTVWNDVDLPDDIVLIPGAVSHSTNVVEHPELVAQRLRHFTDLVGKDRVIASTDCGLGGRIHADIAWAKLETLVEGASRV